MGAKREAHFTQSFFHHNSNSIEISFLSNSVLNRATIKYFTHDRTAVLLRYMQKFVATRWSVTESKQCKFSVEFKFWMIKILWNGCLNEIMAWHCAYIDDIGRIKMAHFMTRQCVIYIYTYVLLSGPCIANQHRAFSLSCHCVNKHIYLKRLNKIDGDRYLEVFWSGIYVRVMHVMCLLAHSVPDAVDEIIWENRAKMSSDILTACIARVSTTMISIIYDKWASRLPRWWL